jgi:hypothetical protein
MLVGLATFENVAFFRKGQPGEAPPMISSTFAGMGCYQQ